MPRNSSAHGTWSRYTNHACRCVPCKAAGSAHMKQYRAALRAGTRVVQSPESREDTIHERIQAELRGDVHARSATGR